MWDVVNEALADGDEGYLRESIYSRTNRDDFIDTAFRTAREQDPDALLIYNDYNCHFPGKRKKLIRLLTELKDRGVPWMPTGCRDILNLVMTPLPSFAIRSTHCVSWIFKWWFRSWTSTW